MLASHYLETPIRGLWRGAIQLHAQRAVDWLSLSGGKVSIQWLVPRWIQRLSTHSPPPPLQQVGQEDGFY